MKGAGAITEIYRGLADPGKDLETGRAGELAGNNLADLENLLPLNNSSRVFREVMDFAGQTR